MNTILLYGDVWQKTTKFLQNLGKFHVKKWIRFSKEQKNCRNRLKRELGIVIRKIAGYAGKQ